MTNSVKSNQAASLFVGIDTFCDFVPVVSTINNLINLVCKAVIGIFKKCAPQIYDHMRKNQWVKHLNNKDIKACAILIVPIVNIFGAIDQHIFKPFSFLFR